MPSSPIRATWKVSKLCGPEGMGDVVVVADKLVVDDETAVVVIGATAEAEGGWLIGSGPGAPAP
jgi:hypothetical protein